MKRKKRKKDHQKAQPTNPRRKELPLREGGTGTEGRLILSTDTREKGTEREKGRS